MKSKILCKIIMCTLLLSMTTVTSSEIDQFHDLSFEELLTIDIQTGSFLELDLMNSPFSMTIINKKQVYSSGARHLTELLEIYVPGFQYMYNRWNGEIWGMRGIAADRNTKFIFLVNGHKMNTEARDGATSEINLGLLNDIERVEVLRGPAGLVYGSGAIAGIINIVTKSSNKPSLTESVLTVGTWDFSSTNRQIETQISRTVSSEQNFTFHFGYRESEGNPAENTRIWGKAHWPYPNWLDPVSESVPAAGCSWCTPGNWKIDLDWNYKNLELRTRVTHQVSNAGGLYILDAWPEDQGNSDSTNGSRWIDGKNEAAWEQNIDGERVATWWGSVETWGTNRRQYQHDNIMTEAKYTIPMKQNKLLLKAGFDGNTNRLQFEKREGFEELYGSERSIQIEETFGEKRYTIGAQYFLNSIENLQLASGYEFRYDAIGKDLSGRNGQTENATHPTVSNIDYINHALYSEGFYELSPLLAFHLGGRYDIHTRTIEQGGVFTPKAAVIIKPNENHSLKLIYQTSANNGSADNYEYNRNHFDDNGIAQNGYQFHNEADPPNIDENPIIPGVTEDELHKLKPEKVKSLELTSVHIIDNISIMPSISWNQVSDLFMWNQSSFRVVNSGEYEFLNIDVDVKYSSKFVSLGLNHTMQKPINLKMSEQDHIISTDVFSDSSFEAYINPVTNDTNYKPIPIGQKVDTINAIEQQISSDGDNFINLATHVSKLYVDLNILKTLSLHSDVRIFWGLPGRKDKMKEAPDFTWLDAHKDPIVKLNASLHWSFADDLRVSLYAYDLLAEKTGKYATHSLRWQQTSSPDQIDLYGFDQRSFSIQIAKQF